MTNNFSHGIKLEYLIHSHSTSSLTQRPPQIQRDNHLRPHTYHCEECAPGVGTSPRRLDSCCCDLPPHLTQTRVGLRRSRIPLDTMSCPSPAYSLDFLNFPTSDKNSWGFMKSLDFSMASDLDTVRAMPHRRG